MFFNLQDALGNIQCLICLSFYIGTFFVSQDNPGNFFHGLSNLIGLDFGSQSCLNSCQGRTKTGCQQQHKPCLKKIAVFNIIHINYPPWAVVCSSD